MPRLTRVNHEIGQRSSFFGPPTPAYVSESNGYNLNRINPAGTGNQIIPQVITSPWSTDDAGVSIPAGTRAVRVISPGRATEEVLSGTDGDSWILVPGTLPGGYTGRTERDHNKGGTNPLAFFPTSGFRGNPYFFTDLAGTNAGVLGTNDAASYYYVERRFIVNGVDPNSVTDVNYRPTGGGGLVPVTFFPVNLNAKVVDSALRDAGQPTTATPWWSFFPTGGQFTGAWLLPHPGWRNIRLRIGVASVGAAHGIGNFELCIRHNADNSRAHVGDTSDYYVSVSAAPLVNWFTSGGVYYWDMTVDLGSALPATKINTPFFIGACFSGGSAAWYGEELINGHETRIYASPRVDIPFWFSTYGAGIYAPGGVV